MSFDENADYDFTLDVPNVRFGKLIAIPGGFGPPGPKGDKGDKGDIGPVGPAGGLTTFASLSAFPAAGDTGLLYVAADTGTTYRWSGSTYIAISDKVTSEGITDSTAVGRALVTAPDEAAARTSIGAEAAVSKGQPGGYPPLDETGAVPEEFLPAQALSVREFPTGDDFPAVGESNVLYVDQSNGDVFRWNPAAVALRAEWKDRLADDLADGVTGVEVYEAFDGLPDRRSLDAAARALTDYQRVSERVKVTGVEATGDLNDDTYLRGDATWSPAYTDGAEGFADRLLDRMTVRAPDSRRVVIEGLIRDLMTAGIWDKLDGFYVFAAHHPQAARLNWKSSVMADATAVNAPPFEVDRGYTGDGTTAYLDTHTLPSMYRNFKTQDASVGVYARTSVSSTTQTDFYLPTGTSINVSNSTSTVVRLTYSSGSAFAAANSGDRTGLFMANRLGDALTVYKDGVSIGAGTAGTPVTPTVGASFMRSGLSGYSTRQLSAGFIGASLTAQQHADLYTALTIYLSELGAAV